MRATYIQVVAGYHGEMALDRQAFKKKFYTTRQYICEDDKEFNDALTEQDINTELYTQTLNSPDVNLLDLGFFRAIQSFNDTVQSCFNQIILNYGDNDYNIEHISKKKLE